LGHTKFYVCIAVLLVMARGEAMVKAAQAADDEKLGRGELRTLIGVPDFGLAEAERALQGAE
jgi:hypothetical protein